MAATGLDNKVGKGAGCQKGSALNPSVGFGCGVALITTFEKPKITPFHLLKILPLIRTAPNCIERAGDSKEESPISSLVGSG